MRLKVLATGTVALALLIGVSYLPTAAGWPGLVMVLLLLAAFAAGWPRLLKVPSPNPVSLVVFLASAATALLAYVEEPLPGLLWLAPAVGIGTIVMFLTQLFRGANATSRLESAASGMAGLVIACLGAGWIGVGDDPAWRDLALIGALTILAAAIPGVLRWPDRIAFPLGFVLAVLVGGAASIVNSAVHVVPALVLGAACGLVVVGSRAMLVSAGGPRNTVQMLAAATAPVLVCGSVVWYAQLLIA